MLSSKIKMRNTKDNMSENKWPSLGWGLVGHSEVSLVLFFGKHCFRKETPKYKPIQDS